mmetsp:Transcript_38181/g.106360  ORF Transcript_38181/g.106360 Transcript_38181/m.106360 type:complete len:262 (-) Transcript_38181:664-1449(-)
MSGLGGTPLQVLRLAAGARPGCLHRAHSARPPSGRRVAPCNTVAELVQVEVGGSRPDAAGRGGPDRADDVKQLCCHERAKRRGVRCEDPALRGEPPQWRPTPHILPGPVARCHGRLGFCSAGGASGRPPAGSRRSMLCSGCALTHGGSRRPRADAADARLEGRHRSAHGVVRGAEKHVVRDDHRPLARHSEGRPRGGAHYPEETLEQLSPRQPEPLWCRAVGKRAHRWAVPEATAEAAGPRHGLPKQVGRGDLDLPRWLPL